MKLRTLATTLIMTAAVSGLPPGRLAAQQEQQVPRPEQIVVERASAERTREQLRDILRGYPPSLWEVLRLDPSLLANAAYLTPYPGLSAYLSQHPEIAHNPSFFIGDPRFSTNDPNRRTVDAIEESLAGLAFFLFFMTALGVATHVGRSILEHRRWMHATKIQTDAHTKLVDRFSSNDELLAYVQSPAGQRILSATPVAVETGGGWSGFQAPIGRILTSIQIGVVATFGGIGLWLAKNRVIEEVAQPLHVLSILAIGLGIGFVVSALMSYGLSKQLGLLKPSANA